jgi:hypothetical protein
MADGDDQGKVFESGASSRFGFPESFVIDNEHRVPSSYTYLPIADVPAVPTCLINLLYLPLV